MKRALLLAILVLLARPAMAVNLSGSLLNPDGSGVTGRLYLSLSQQSSQLSTGGCGGPAVLVPTAQVVLLITNGSVTNLAGGTASVIGNDCIAPTNTYYVAIARDANGNVLFNMNWQITVANCGSPCNLGTIPPVIVPQGTTVGGAAFFTNLNVTNCTGCGVTPGAVGDLLSFNSGGTTGGDSGIPSSAAVTTTGSQTLTNKSLTSPIVTGTLSGNPTIPSPTTTGTDNGTETVQNKTLDGVSNGNSVTLLNFQGPASAVTGTGSAAVFYTYTLPANTLGVNKCLRLDVGSIHSTGSASINYTVSFGGSGPSAFGDAGVAPGVNVFLVRICNTGATNSQIVSITGDSATSGTTFTVMTTTAISTTSNVTINMDFNVANTDKITPEWFIADIVQ